MTSTEIDIPYLASLMNDHKLSKAEKLRRLSALYFGVLRAYEQLCNLTIRQALAACEYLKSILPKLFFCIKQLNGKIEQFNGYDAIIGNQIILFDEFGDDVSDDGRFWSSNFFDMYLDQYPEFDFFIRLDLFRGYPHQ